MAESIPYLERLNPKQREAVEHYGTPLLILAGAGSGKTRVISTKIAHLVDRGFVDPQSILAVTFTNKAAREMQRRTLELSAATERVMFKTFHSFGAWMLRRNGRLLGLGSAFKIYDEQDSLALMQRIAAEPDATTPPAARTTWSRVELRRISTQISRAKDYCIGPRGNLSSMPGVRDGDVLPYFYTRYQDRLLLSGSVDFGDLIMSSVALLREHPAVARRMRQRFTVVLVDEYQDSNMAQFQLLRLLWEEGNYLCVVGDDDQSIYKFRGAVVENIVTFPDVFPQTTIIRLERNYRSTQNILDVASSVVANNSGRLGKTLVADKPPGPSVTVTFLENQDDEARFVADLLSDGAYASTAVLYRMNYQSRTFETYFSRAGIPYRVVGTVRFYERAEVKDAVAYLALLLNPRDEVAFLRAVNQPKRGLGEKSRAAILFRRLERNMDFIEAARSVAEDLPARAAAGARRFAEVITSAGEQLEVRPFHEAVDFVIEESGLYDHYEALDAVDNTGRVDNLRELVNGAVPASMGRPGLTAFLEDAALDPGGEDPYEPESRVTLITLHNTKGLEYDRVVITGLEEGIFPHEWEQEVDIEEERRLFYVGITRARDQLFLTSCRSRRTYGQNRVCLPSQFLSEIPDELVEVADTTGSGRAGGDSEADDGFGKGAAVYHDSYGPGVIVDRQRRAEESVVFVRFSTGRTNRFVLRFSGLERIADDGF